MIYVYLYSICARAAYSPMFRAAQPDSTMATRVLRLRIKDKHAPWLREMAFHVNQVWNYCNELGFKVWLRERRFMSGFDFAAYTRGATKEGLPLHSQTVQAVAEEFATRRRQFRKVKLRWRVSKGAKRSLGWIPFKSSAIQYRNGQVFLAGKPLGLWDTYGLSNYRLGSGSLSEDARGRWYLNVTVKVQKQARPATAALGKTVALDLNLHSVATSDADLLEFEQHHRILEEKIVRAQRAKKPKLVRALCAKAANRRKDQHHKHSTALVRRYDAIFVGNVSSLALAKTRMAKSALDAGWGIFRTMLRYKCDDAGVWFEEVNEAHSTQTCSCCQSRTGPKGVAGLGIREWSCDVCGAYHHRDINAAINILAAGRGRLAGGIHALSA
jgi:putative transposase